MVTPVQHKIYEFIQSYIKQYGYSPTLQEIASGIGISPKSISLISRSIHALVAAGRLSFDKKGYRNIQVAGATEGFLLPLMGRIAAGEPIEAIEARRTVDLRELLQGEDHFMLEVKGDSMIEDGIFDGDLVICKQTQHGKEGDVIVALVDQQEATLKRLSYKVPGRITLIPANPTLKPKAYLPHRVQIQGVYVGLVRVKRG